MLISIILLKAKKVIELLKYDVIKIDQHIYQER
jgi:hypothetical protein